MTDRTIKQKKKVKLTIKINNRSLTDYSDGEFEYTDEEIAAFMPKDSEVLNETPLDIDENGNYVIKLRNRDTGSESQIREMPFTDEIFDCEDDDKTALYTASGEIYDMEDAIQINYNEAEFADMPDEITTLLFLKKEPTLVTLGRNGMCKTLMAFEAGKTYKSVYTAFGASFDMNSTTYKLINTVTYENGGLIVLDYALTTGGAFLSKTYMSILVENTD